MGRFGFDKFQNFKDNCKRFRWLLEAYSKKLRAESRWWLFDFRFVAMTLAEFKTSLHQAAPPFNLSPVLEALWYAGKGDWERAHNIAQDIHTPEGSWVHAYLHRVEGDIGNASYWYHRAGKPVAIGDLKKEWQSILSNLLPNQFRN